MWKQKIKTVQCRIVRCDCWWQRCSYPGLEGMSARPHASLEIPVLPSMCLGSQSQPSAFHVKETSYQGLFNRHSLQNSQTCFSHDLSHFMVQLSDAMGLPPQYLLHTWTVILLMPGFTAYVFILKPFSLDPSPVACLSLLLSLLTVPRGSDCRSAHQPSLSCLSFAGQACSWACCLPDWHPQHCRATAFPPVLCSGEGAPFAPTFPMDGEQTALPALAGAFPTGYFWAVPQ